MSTNQRPQLEVTQGIKALPFKRHPALKMKRCETYMIWVGVFFQHVQSFHPDHKSLLCFFFLSDFISSECEHDGSARSHGILHVAGCEAYCLKEPLGLQNKNRGMRRSHHWNTWTVCKAPGHGDWTGRGKAPSSHARFLHGYCMHITKIASQFPQMVNEVVLPRESCHPRANWKRGGQHVW